jgi:hypothetical protein
MACNESVSSAACAELHRDVCRPESLDAWFAREILSYEAALVRYLTRIWFARDEILDLMKFSICGRRSIFESTRQQRNSVPTRPRRFCSLLPGISSPIGCAASA